MRSYTITINNKPYELAVDEVSATKFKVQIDGKTVDAELATHRAAARGADAPAAAEPAVQAAPAAVTPDVSAAASASAMTAPMPGVIVEVRTTPGAQVNQGDTLLILEAMKMKNELHASRSGVIESVLVSAGEQVKYGQSLLTFAEE